MCQKIARICGWLGEHEILDPQNANVLRSWRSKVSLAQSQPFDLLVSPFWSIFSHGPKRLTFYFWVLWATEKWFGSNVQARFVGSVWFNMYDASIGSRHGLVSNSRPRNMELVPSGHFRWSFDSPRCEREHECVGLDIDELTVSNLHSRQISKAWLEMALHSNSRGVTLVCPRAMKRGKYVECPELELATLGTLRLATLRCPLPHGQASTSIMSRAASTVISLALRTGDASGEPPVEPGPMEL